VICTPGLEDVCRQELLALGCKPKPAGPGALEMDATARQLYASNVWLRTASRVVVRVETFRSTDLGHFRRRIDAIDWDRWLPGGMAPRFRVTSNESKLYHTDAVAERLHDVAGEAPDDDDELGQLFIVRIYRNTVTISADSSGAALHHRPWRTELGRAPLRATMGAALLLAADYDPSQPLLDPFCGCGTIPIEAALIARDRPPGGSREYAFQRWGEFEPGTWASIGGEVTARAKTAADAMPADRAEPLIVGSDRDEAIIAAASGNAERAGVADHVRFETKVVSHLSAADGPGLILTNPPYGKRVGDGDLRGLYRRFGSVVRERRPGWRLALLCSDRKLAILADRELAPLARFRHGGLPVELLSAPRP
jgi:putative N6-adenine-specific DNA methylase